MMLLLPSSRHRMLLRLLLSLCSAFAIEARAQSGPVSWSGSVGVFLALKDQSPVPDVRALLQPTAAVSLSATFGGASGVWRARGLLAVPTGFKVTPKASCGPFCTEPSGRDGAVLFGIVDRLYRVRNGERPVMIRAGAGFRSQIFPGLGSTCDPGDTACTTAIDLSTRSFGPALQVGVMSALGRAWRVDLGTSISRNSGRTQVELSLMADRRLSR